MIATAAESSPERYAPNQAIVEFLPGVVLVPPNPGEKVIPIGQAPMPPLLLGSLLNLGATHFELIGRPWRWIERASERELPEDHVPPLLKSFRDIYLVHFAGERSVEDLLRDLRSMPEVVSAGGNVFMELPYWPDDEYLPCPASPCDDTDPNYQNYQWNLENAGGTINGIECDGTTDIGLRGAYDIQSECTVKVGLMDTGVQKYESGSPPTFHEDLEDNLDYVLGRNFAGPVPGDSLAWGEDGAYSDGLGHGTPVAGILGAIHNEIGIAGICGRFPENDPVLVPLRIWPLEDDSSSMKGVASSLVDALAYNSANVASIPIALVEAELEDKPLDPLDDDDISTLKFAVHNAYHAGLTIVAAAGNSEAGLLGSGIYPVDFLRMVVGVGALGCDGERPDGFATGARVDLSAPGSGDDGSGGSKDQIVTTSYGNAYRVVDGDLFSGTSAAAPHVAGVAALAMSYESALTNEDVREVMERTARDMGTLGRDSDYGHGLVRADSVLLALRDYDLVHGSTAAIDSWTIAETDSCRPQTFRNIATITGGSPNATPETIGDSPPVERDVRVYTFETTVPLTANTSAHVPEVWARGRESLSARNIAEYDGALEPYFAEVVSVTADSAKFRGYAYEVFPVGCDCHPDSTKGWYPLSPVAPSLSTKFAFSYLADTGSSRPGRRPEITALRIPPGTTLQLRDERVEIRFFAPSRSRSAKLYDIAGRLVAEVHPPEGAAGWTTLEWDGRSNDGRKVASGVYFATIESGGHDASVRILVLR